MTNLRKVFAAGLLTLLLGSITGCIIAERPYAGHPNRYGDPGGYRSPDPRWRHGRYDRYERNRDHRHDDYRHRDRDRD